MPWSRYHWRRRSLPISTVEKVAPQRCRRWSKHTSSTPATVMGYMLTSVRSIFFTGHDQRQLAGGNPSRLALAILQAHRTPPGLAPPPTAPQGSSLGQFAHNLRFGGQSQVERQHILRPTHDGIALSDRTVVHADASAWVLLARGHPHLN